MDSHEDEGLWNELSNQQSREIQQYHARERHRIQDAGRSLGALWQRFAEQSSEELRQLTNVFKEAARGAWREQQERRASFSYGRPAAEMMSSNNSMYIDNNNNPSTCLNEFGISDEGTRERFAPLGELQENGFTLIPRIRNRPSHGWGAVADLDIFFTSLYTYYYHRGLLPIICKGVVELVSLFFTLFLSVFLFAYIDWKSLSKCIDETTCHPDFFESYIRQDPLQHFSWWTVIVVLYCVIFTAYGFFSVWSFFSTLHQALNAKWVFEERLGISARKLQGGAIDWDRHVVTRLIELQRSGDYRIAIHGQGELDALVIAQRIMRKENFMVALFNKGLIDLSVPFLGNSFFCPSIEWSLYFCILNFMFNHKYQVRPAFYLDPSALRRRFFVCGLAHVIFMPFLLFFLMLHFGLQNAYDWKSTKRYLGPREWSRSAKWVFREFNELQHHFERRLAPSYDVAEAYLKLFGQNELITALGRILVFIGGSLGAVLFTFAAMNDAILLHVKIADWNLLWFAGLVGAIYSVGKGMLPNEAEVPRNVRNMFAETDAALADVAKHTHYYPEHWKGHASDTMVKKTFSASFQYKAQLFATEVAAVILAPYIMCVSLAKCAVPICEFIVAVKEEVAGAGEVCGFSTFDFDKYEDETWQGRTIGPNAASGLSQSILRMRNVTEATQAFPRPKACYGKMEKSFFSFKTTHPGWKCSISGQHLVDRVEAYKREETTAFSREQEFHIKAAARQLETLARLERDQHDPSLLGVDESYIYNTQIPANIGADVIENSQIFPIHQEQVLPLQDLDVESIQTQEGVPPFVFPDGHVCHSPSKLLTTKENKLPSGVVRADLSTELRKIFIMSTFDPNVTAASNVVASVSSVDEERLIERQYLWLERYHAHLAAQQDHSSALLLNSRCREDV